MAQPESGTLLMYRWKSKSETGHSDFIARFLEVSPEFADSPAVVQQYQRESTINELPEIMTTLLCRIVIENVVVASSRFYYPDESVRIDARRERIDGSI